MKNIKFFNSIYLKSFYNNLFRLNNIAQLKTGKSGYKSLRVIFCYFGNKGIYTYNFLGGVVKTRLGSNNINKTFTILQKIAKTHVTLNIPLHYPFIKMYLK
jgi:hypothetical protein